jgi:DMSO/TMAO reductase YedYZ molybdopterin-dependent catalytic subunit
LGLTAAKTAEFAETHRGSSLAQSKHGAPLRLRNEIELGFKQVKWIRGIEFVAHYSEVGGGFGGYNQDHEFFGYRQSI